jgi:hypothetical protein
MGSFSRPKFSFFLLWINKKGEKFNIYGRQHISNGQNCACGMPLVTGISDRREFLLITDNRKTSDGPVYGPVTGII